MTIPDSPALDLDALTALEQAVPAAPWRVAESSPAWGIRTEGGWELVYASYADSGPQVLAFIAAARNALPALPSCTKGCPGVLCDHPDACPLDAEPVPAGGGDTPSIAVPPNSCQHDGIDKHDHAWRWVQGVGWHNWAEPSDELRKARMLARRDGTAGGEDGSGTADGTFAELATRAIETKAPLDIAAALNAYGEAPRCACPEVDVTMPAGWRCPVHGAADPS